MKRMPGSGQCLPARCALAGACDGAKQGFIVDLASTTSNNAQPTNRRRPRKRRNEAQTKRTEAQKGKELNGEFQYIQSNGMRPSSLLLPAAAAAVAAAVVLIRRCSSTSTASAAAQEIRIQSQIRCAGLSARRHLWTRPEIQTLRRCARSLAVLFFPYFSDLPGEKASEQHPHRYSDPDGPSRAPTHAQTRQRRELCEESAAQNHVRRSSCRQLQAFLSSFVPFPMSRIDDEGKSENMARLISP